MKKQRLLVLCLAILFCCNLFISASATTQSGYRLETEAPLYIMSDPNKFYDLVGEGEVELITHTIATNSVSQTTTYTFDLDNEGALPAISLSGVLDSSLGNETKKIRIGTLKGAAIINNTYCQISAVIQQSYFGQSFCSGVTIMPMNSSVEDYIYIAIGQSLVEKDMLPEDYFTNIHSQSIRSDAIPAVTRATTLYRLQNLASTTSGDQVLAFFFNSNNRRALVRVSSNTALIEDGLSDQGIVNSMVSSIKIGLRSSPSSQNAYINNIHNIPHGNNAGSDVINTDYISYILDVLSIIYEDASIVTSTLQFMLESAADNASTTDDCYVTGSHSYVEFNFAAKEYNFEDIDFDDAPMIVEFNLLPNGSSSGGFYAYSEIEYSTLILYSDAYVYVFPSPVKTVSTNTCTLYF